MTLKFKNGEKPLRVGSKSNFEVFQSEGFWWLKISQNGRRTAVAVLFLVSKDEADLTVANIQTAINRGNKAFYT
ncbi:MAG: hypothetical protein IJT73_07350 [Selenomonadaceae bacterium]|nr:hypothetical protein [Selenomonadaceae bacterium]